MVITVDKLSDDPLYLQLRDAVIAGIASGELRPGDALPSVRSLAEDLGINLHTVNKAYATLRDEGYVIMLGRRGAYVADAPADPAAGMDEAALEAPSSRRPAAPGTHFSRPPNAPHGTWTRERTCRLTS